MKITFSYPKYSFSKTKFVEDWYKLIRKDFRIAAQAFYTTVWYEVPVWTGMSRGSLVPLGKAIKNVPTAISPKKRRERGRPVRLYPGVKDLAAGIQLGEDAFVWENGKGKHVLEFNIKVFHYMLNEKGKGNNNAAAWFSLPKGRYVFKAAFEGLQTGQQLRGLLPKNLKARIVEV